jgi:DNA-binding IclR family transcriptional regulator
MTIRIRRLLALRGRVSDRTLLDFLHLVILIPQAGQVGTRELCAAWKCAPSTVSRRLHALVNAGLADITRGHGAYQVHAVSTLEEAA